ncbi:hypothetical protein [Azospirillum sp. ST 5-10]|uniref:hypothetical protein n=1 Tax=unclassified Azospirillum TaxID=2630922 RepID=UPI003F4A3AA3
MRPSKKRLRLSDACYDAFVRAKHPIVARYDVLRTIGQIAWEGGYRGTSVYSLARVASDSDYRRVVRQLTAEFKLAPDAEFPSGIYTVNRLPDATAEEACCLVDPFAYVSHFSAMEHYGLTDRIPENLVITRPEERAWRSLAEAVVANDRASLGEALDGFTSFRLLRHEFPGVVRQRPVKVFTPKVVGRSVRLRESHVRMARIDQVFCDTLLAPQLCGGMAHVMEVWRDHARTYLERIVTAVNALDSPIAKVRAGYILSDYLGVSHAIVEGWRAFAQRGGSRRLDPNSDGRPTFSEGWMLSINVDLPAVSG